MSSITREEFLSSIKVKFPVTEQVTVPGLGTVLVKKMNAGEQDRFEVANAENKASDFRARLTVATTIDERGIHLFTEDDIPALSLCDVEVLDPIVERALKLNASFSKEYREQLRKNSTGQAVTS